MSERSSKDELLMLYEVTCADLVYFKSQQWHVVNYTVLAFAALVGIAQIFRDNQTGWFLAAFAFSTFIFSKLMLKSLNGSIMQRRARLKAVAPPDGAEGATAGTAASQPQAGGGAFGQPRNREHWEKDPNKPQYRNDYARDHLPRFATMPWTAPVFDNRTVTSDPQLICMSSMDGHDVAGDYREPSCTCLTEQGTRVEISQPECRKVARFGPQYNPYRQQRPEPSRREFGGVGGSPLTAMASVDAAPSSGATITAPQVTGYGDIGPRRIEPAPVGRW